MARPKRGNELYEEAEDPKFICRRCHKPFELVKGRSIVNPKKDKFLCPRCFDLLFSYWR